MARRSWVLGAATLAVLLGHGWLLWRLPYWSAAALVAPQESPVAQNATVVPVIPVVPEPPPTPPDAPPPKPPALIRPKSAVQPMPRARQAPQPIATPAPVPVPEAAAADDHDVDAASPAPTDMASAGDAAGKGAGAGADPTAAPAQPPAPDPADDAAEGTSDAAQTALGQQIRPAKGPALPPGTPVPVAIAAPVRLEYEARGQVKGFNYSAGAQLVWRHDDERYELTQSISMFLMGRRSQTSTGRITDLGLAPERFVDQGRKEQTARFDRAAGKAHYSGGTPDADISAGVQDRVSVFMQLSALIAAAPDQYPPGTVIALTTSSARRADRWSFRVAGVENLRLPAGSLPALRLDKLPGASPSPNATQATLWLGTELDYLPVRIRLTQGPQDYVDLGLQSHGQP